MYCFVSIYSGLQLSISNIWFSISMSNVWGSCSSLLQLFGCVEPLYIQYLYNIYIAFLYLSISNIWWSYVSIFTIWCSCTSLHPIFSSICIWNILFFCNSLYQISGVPRPLYIWYMLVLYLSISDIWWSCTPPSSLSSWVGNHPGFSLASSRHPQAWGDSSSVNSARIIWDFFGFWRTHVLLSSSQAPC